MSKKCPYCGREYPELSRYCPYCGSPNPTYVKKTDDGPQMHWVRLLTLFLVGFIGFQIVGTLLQIPFLIKAYSDFGENKQAIVQYLDSAPVSMFVNSIAYCILFSALLLVAKPSISKLVKSFTNGRAYLGALLAFVCIYAFNIVYSIILSIAGVDFSANNNQSTLESIIKVYPLVSLIVFGILGPICEELTYRVGLFDVLKRRNRILAYVGTIVIFTLIHFDFGASNMVNELVNIPYYVAAAFAFTYVYDKFGFAASVSAHVINNLQSVIVNII